jgi:dipeptidyl aminopeptidase/acylaminoacyl peptidase
MGLGRMIAVAALATTMLAGVARAESFSLEKALSFPFVNELTAASKADRIAWVRIEHGVRNVWVADGPKFEPKQVTEFKDDDGQEITHLAFSPDGETLVFVRGGDHDSNWPAEGGLAPDPDSSPVQPKVTLWAADPTGAKPAWKLVEGDDPTVSAKHVVAYRSGGQIWTVGLDGKDAHRLFFDRGQDGSLAWSPDGGRLAFVSNRGDHAFVGIYDSADKPLSWLAPSTGIDGSPVWSPDGARIAFTRQPGVGGAPDTMLANTPQPWEIWSADAATGAGHAVWKSPNTLHGSYPDVAGEANLHWAAGGRLTFLAFLDNWPHLYAVSEAGGEAKLLTPGAFMVEHVAATPDGKALVYSANTGTTPDDDDRRHLFRVSVDGGAPVAVTKGESLEWSPVATPNGLAFIAASAKQPPAVAIPGAGAPQVLDHQASPEGFPGASFVTPKQVAFKAPDGLLVHGQLFEAAGGAAKKPGVIFVHGGPPRQMMLGFSYMRYYSNAYAVNQYLAAHGFAVLSVNYRLGIGYGWDFQHPDKGGPTGSSEYQDVLAGAKFLQAQAGVDPARVGIWGGSYGGLLTALALARNSDVFKAGVDLHGVHDWSREPFYWEDDTGHPWSRYEQGDRAQAAEVAYKASPIADVATWTSPVLLIQGDDDRNVRFHQTIDLARRLRAKGDVEVEELVIPDEIHDFLRWADWYKADRATTEFLARKLGAPQGN